MDVHNSSGTLANTNIEGLATILNDFQPLTILAKLFSSDACDSPGYPLQKKVTHIY